MHTHTYNSLAFIHFIFSMAYGRLLVSPCEPIQYLKIHLLCIYLFKFACAATTVPDNACRVRWPSALHHIHLTTPNWTHHQPLNNALLNAHCIIALMWHVCHCSQTPKNNTHLYPIICALQKKTNYFILTFNHNFVLLFQIILKNFWDVLLIPLHLLWCAWRTNARWI